MRILNFREEFQAFHRKIKDSQSLTGATFHLIIAQGIGFLTLFLLDLWLVRVLGRVEFGTWKQFIWGVRFFVPLFYLGLPESYRYFSAVDRENYRIHFFRITCLIVIIGGGLFVVEYFDGFKYFAILTQNASFNQVSIWFPILITLSAIKFILRIHAIFIQNTLSVINANIIFSMGLLIIGAVVTYQHNSLLQIIILGWLVAEGIRIAYYWLALHRTLTPLPKWKGFSLNHISKYFKYGIPYYFSTAIFLLFLNIDKLIISRLGGVQAFAVYAIAAIEIPFITAIFVSVSQNLFPRLAAVYHESSDKAFSMWFDVYRKVSYLIYPVIILLLWIARPLFLTLYTEAYASGLGVFKVYILLLIWRTASYSILLNVAGKPHINLFINGFFLTLNFALSYVIYPIQGMMGVVWVTFFTFTLMNLTILMYLNKFKLFVYYLWRDKLLMGFIVLIVISYFGSNMV